MATWNDAKEFILKNYNEILDNMDELIRIRIIIKNTRSQEVIVSKMDFGNGNIWASISSRIGDINSNSLNNALSFLADKNYCGAFIRIKDTHYIRHCVPLKNMQIDEIAAPISMVAEISDEIEKIFIRTDRF